MNTKFIYIWLYSYSDYDTSVVDNSKSTYDLETVINAVEEASDWDEIVLEDFTAKDCLYSVAEYFDLDVSDQYKFETTDSILTAVKEILEK